MYLCNYHTHAYATKRQKRPNTWLKVSKHMAQNLYVYSDGLQRPLISYYLYHCIWRERVLFVSLVPSKSDSDKKLKEPIFKPFQVSKTSQKLVQESQSDFAKAIREQLDRI